MKEILIVFVILYLIMFVIDYFLLKKVMISEYDFMRNWFKLPKKNKNFIDSIKPICSLINAFILSLVCTFAILSDFPIYLNLPISFVLLLILIISLYSIYGNILVKKIGKKKSKK